jgi:hypothetical protein
VDFSEDIPMNLFKWKKVDKWTWKSDVRFYFYQLPLETLRAIIGIAQKDHILNDMDKWEYIDLAKGIADMKCGRFYRDELA